jgi:hypothetical protein
LLKVYEYEEVFKCQKVTSPNTPISSSGRRSTLRRVMKAVVYRKTRLNAVPGLR